MEEKIEKKFEFDLDALDCMREYRERAYVRHQFIKDIHPVDVNGNMDGLVFNSKKTVKAYKCTVFDSKKNAEKSFDKNWFDGKGFNCFDELMERINKSPDTANYVSVNTFKEKSRKAVNVAFLHDFFIDIDILHNSDIPKEELNSRIGEIKEKIIERFKKASKQQVIPLWNYFLFTGHGLALHWFITPINSEEKELVAKYDEAYRRIYGVIEGLLVGIECDVDSTVIAEHARVCRIPGTLNIKNDVYCTVLERNDIERRSLDELWSGFHLDENDAWSYIGRLSKNNTVKKTANIDVIEGEGEREGEGGLDISPAPSITKPVQSTLTHPQPECLTNLSEVINKSGIEPIKNKQKTSEIIINKKVRDILKSQKNFIEYIVENRNGKINRKEFLINQEYSRCSGRECTLFAYYNIIRVLKNDVKACSKQLIAINEKFAEKLDDIEVENIINEVEQHIVVDGKPYSFSNLTLFYFIGATEEERAACQFGVASKKRAQGKKNNDASICRDIEVFKLWQQGIKYEDISQILAEQKIDCPPDTARKIIKRLGFNGVKKSERCKINIADVPFEEKKIYTRKSNLENQISQDEIRSCQIDDECAGMSDDEYWDYKESQVFENSNIRLVGSGGTGKTTLINKCCDLMETQGYKVLKLAPTGVAAEHIGGRTLHSALFLPKEVLPQDYGLRMSVPETIKSVDVVVVDEIGMVRIDVFEALMNFIKRVETEENKRIKVILSGDFLQLPPTVTTKDKTLLIQYENFKYGYLFESTLRDEFDFFTVKLTRVFRQKDKVYADICNNIKYGINKDNALHLLKTIASLAQEDMPEATYLCPLKKQVNEINNRRVEEYDNTTVFEETHIGTLSGCELPVARKLELAVGMKVMTTVNTDTYKNGSVGVIKSIESDCIKVEFGKKGAANHHIWKVERHCFHLENGSTYWQLPIQYSWAISIHKSQSCTIEGKVVIMPGIFESGMLYTALTRATDGTNVYFEKFPDVKDIKVNESALKFAMAYENYNDFLVK